MSTHNIGFYEEISKIITYLSSNIIKYAPYFFYCQRVRFENGKIPEQQQNKVVLRQFLYYPPWSPGQYICIYNFHIPEEGYCI